MSGITSASRRSSSPGTKAPPTITPKAFESFLTHLSFYDTLLSEIPGSNATDMVKKKKQEDILKFIQTFHTRTLSQVTSGRYAGFWQTRVGTGRENSRYIRCGRSLYRRRGIRTPRKSKKFFHGGDAGGHCLCPCKSCKGICDSEYSGT